MFNLTNNRLARGSLTHSQVKMMDESLKINEVQLQNNAISCLVIWRRTLSIINPKVSSEMGQTNMSPGEPCRVKGIFYIVKLLAFVDLKGLQYHY